MLYDKIFPNHGRVLPLVFLVNKKEKAMEWQQPLHMFVRALPTELLLSKRVGWTWTNDPGIISPENEVARGHKHSTIRASPAGVTK